MISALYTAAMANTPPEKCYLKTREQHLSYGELDSGVRRLTTLFRQRGVITGDVVLLNVSDDCQLAVLYLACITNGLAAVITDPALPSLQDLTVLVRPRLAFVERGKLAAALPLDVETIAVDQPQRKTRGVLKKLLKKRTVPNEADDSGAYPALLDQLEPYQGEFSSTSADATALVLFTSGTTSEPKGVELTQRNIAALMQITRERYRVDAGAEIFNSLPLHHTDGITLGVTLALAVGATLHRPGRFTVHELPAMMDYIYREGVTHLFTVPTVLALMQRLGAEYSDTFQSGDFKVLVSSCGMLAPELWQSFQQRFNIRVSNGYGLTETTNTFSFCGPDDASFRVGSVGVPVASEVRIVSATGVPVAAGVEGELQLRGDLVMKGYINNPEETAAAFSDGWFQTGDLARLAADGKIEILGRKKSLIIRGGINIHPAEITDIALQHTAIIHAAAFGEPDAIWGETAVLCIVEDSQIHVSDQQLQEFLQRRLASEKMPDEIFRFADFPAGPAGKVILSELREQVQLRRRSRVFSSEGDLYEVIAAIAAELLKVSPQNVSRGSSAENMGGWDSLLHLNLILAVEESYGMEFKPREIMAVQTLGDLVELTQTYLDRA